MDVREKLFTLFQDCNNPSWKWFPNNAEMLKLIDYLIDHGVTVREWISVKEHLPQENEPEGATCEQVQVLLENGVVSTGWCNRHTKLWWHLNYGETHFVGYDYEHTPVIAWQPLAQPPKGE